VFLTPSHKQVPPTKTLVSPTSKDLIINGCKVDIVKNDIVKVAADYDVIVNSTGQNILIGGASCQAILAAAGPAVRDEIASTYPNGIKPGVILKS